MDLLNALNRGLSSPAPKRSRVRTVAMLALVLGCVGCDQASKNVAVSFLPPGRRISLLGDCVRLELMRNSGAFLSLGAGLPEKARFVIFTLGVGLLALVALGVALRRRVATVPAIGAALIAGGGLGNLWDRVVSGGWVTDYLNLGLGPVRTGIFNVADVAIVAGVILLVLRSSPRTTGHESKKADARI